MASHTDQLSGHIDMVILLLHEERYIIRAENSLCFMESARVYIHLYGSLDDTGKIKFPVLDTGISITLIACRNRLGGFIEHSDESLFGEL